jgi:hypothetical protein
MNISSARLLFDTQARRFSREVRHSLISQPAAGLYVRIN